MSFSSDSLLEAVKIYGEDAVRLAINSSDQPKNISSKDFSSWQNKIDLLWSLQPKVVNDLTNIDKPLTPKRAILLHGRNSSSDSHFFVWTKQALISQGFQVISPQIDEKGAGKFETWNQNLQNINSQIDEYTVIIAHSMAALAICKHFDINPNLKCKALHLIGGVFDDFVRPFQPDDLTDQIRSFNQKSINYKTVADQIENIHIHHSLDDQRVVFTNADRYLKAFGKGKIHEYQNRNHFMNQLEFPELVANILTDFEEEKLSLILDFDGVLGNTWEATYATRMAVSRMTKADAIDYERSLLNKPYHAKGMADIKQKLEQKEVWQKQYRKSFASLRPKLFSEFVEVLKSLPDARLAIVSSSEKSLIEEMLKNSDLKFDVILDYKHNFSKEEKVLEVCKIWNISPEKAYYITDTVADVEELKNTLPINNLVGCGWGYQGVYELLKVLPNKNVLINGLDLFNVLQINPQFAFNKLQKSTFSAVQDAVYNPDLSAKDRINKISQAVDICIQLSYIPFSQWKNILLCLAPFAPVISQELWQKSSALFSNLATDELPEFIHEAI